MGKHRISADGTPRLLSKISVNDNVIGSGKVRLLSLIGETGSLSAAAKKMGINYRRAWLLMDTLQKCFDAPLYIAERGGSDQGGTALTPLGEELIARHAAHQKALKSAADPFIDWVVQHKPADAPEN